MAKNPPEGTQRIVPYLMYRDAPAAIDFLCSVFGFEERFRLPLEDGRVGHAELAYGGNVVMLASVFEEMGHASPKELPGLPAQVLCYVDDVDAHYERAKAAGADILSEPEDQPYGDRRYRVRDPEGHQWNFHTHVRDVTPEEMQSAAE